MEINRVIIAHFFLSILVCCNIAFAAKKSVYGNSEYVVTGTMNQATVEHLAMEAARKIASESAGSLIVAQTAVDKNIVQKDEIRVLLRAMAKLVPGSEHKHYEVINKSDNTRKLFYSASFTVDEEEFKRRVEALDRKDKATIRAIEQASKEYGELESTEQQYRKDYETFIKQLGEKNAVVSEKTLNELDTHAQIMHYSELGEEHYQKDNYLLAEKFFLKAAEYYKLLPKKFGTPWQDDKFAAVYYYNAGMSASCVNAERAMEHAKKAHEINPFSELPLELMGICAWKLHKFEDAVSYFKQALSVKESLGTYLKLETLYLTLGEINEFNKIWNEMYEKYHKDCETGTLSKTDFMKFNQLQALSFDYGIYFNIEGKYDLADISFKEMDRIMTAPFSKQVFIKSGYDLINSYELPFDEFCAYKKDSNKTYLLRFYYYLGNKCSIYTLRIMPYENTDVNEKSVYLVPEEGLSLTTRKIFIN